MRNVLRAKLELAVALVVLVAGLAVGAWKTDWKYNTGDLSGPSNLQAGVDDLYDGGVKTNSITSDKIRDGAVTNADLAPDAVTSDKMQAGAVTNSDLAPDAVTSDKIQAGAVTNSDLAADAVTSDKMQDGSVTNADLADGAVSSNKMLSAGLATGTFTNANGETVIIFRGLIIGGTGIF